MTPPDSWFPFFEWCEASFLGQAIQESVWLFPVIEAVHLLGLCMLGGSVLIVDLRMMGVGLTGQPVAELVKNARRWSVIGLATLLSTGVLLFLSEAVKAFYNTSFWVKMTTLPVAVAYLFLVRNRVGRTTALDTTGRTRLVAAGSLALWFTVAAAGRWIGYS